MDQQTLHNELKRLLSDASAERFSKKKRDDVGPYDQMADYLIEHGVTIKEPEPVPKSSKPFMCPFAENYPCKNFDFYNWYSCEDCEPYQRFRDEGKYDV